MVTMKNDDHIEFVSLDQRHYGVRPLTAGIDVILLSCSKNCGKPGPNSQQSEVALHVLCLVFALLVFHDADVLGCFPLTASKMISRRFFLVFLPVFL